MLALIPTDGTLVMIGSVDPRMDVVCADCSHVALPHGAVVPTGMRFPVLCALTEAPLPLALAELLWEPALALREDFTLLYYPHPCMEFTTQ